MALNKEDKGLKLTHVIGKMMSKKFNDFLDLKTLSNENKLANEALVFKFKPCDVFKTFGGKRAVEMAIENQDTEALDKILDVERKCHPQGRDGIQCFRKKVKTDKNSAKAVEMMDLKYDASCASTVIMPLFSVLPLILRLLGMWYDEYTDIVLGIDYYNEGYGNLVNIAHNHTTRHCFSKHEKFEEHYSSRSLRFKTKLPPKEYRFAMMYTMVSVTTMLLLNSPMTYKKLKTWKKTGNLINSRIKEFAAMMISPLISPFVILLSVIEMISLKFRLSKERDKLERTKLEQHYWNLQLEFGMYETVEAVEATAQLLLQLWLLGANYPFYWKEGILELFKRSLKGTLLAFYPDTSIEDKTLGKFLVSLISIIISAFAMYRRTKRDAVQTMSSVLLMVSLLSQILVNVACLAPLYFVERHWLSLVLPILVHYLLVFLLKWIFDPVPYLAKDSRKTIRTLNILGSIMININIIPTKGYIAAKTQKEIAMETGLDITSNENSFKLDEFLSKNKGYSKHKVLKEDEWRVTHHNPSTFFLQTMHFAIKFLENATIVCLLNYYCEIASDPIFIRFPWKMFLILSGVSILSWISHTSYYRLHGHPWKLANGPTFHSDTEEKQKFVKWEYYFRGTRVKKGYMRTQSGKNEWFDDDE